MEYLLPIFIVLAILKIAGVVAWSWWIICIPLYPAAILLTVAFVAMIFGVSISIFSRR